MAKTKIIFAAACMGMLSFGIVMITIGSLLPAIISRFNISGSEAGALTSVLPLGIMAGSLIFGPLADRFGYKVQFIVCSLLVALGLEGIAFSDGLFTLNLSVFLIGFGGGVLNGATNAVVADISEKDKGANLSLLGVFYGVGALGMPALIGALSGVFSVNTIISSVAGTVVLMALYFISISFPAPKHKQGLPIKEAGKLLGEPIVLLSGMVLFFASATEGLFNNWTTLFIARGGEIDDSKALFVLSMLMVAMTVMRIFLGGLLKRFEPYKVLFSLLVMVIAGSLVMFMWQSYPMALVSVILIGAGLAASFPVVLGYVAQYFPTLSGTAFSIALVMALTGNMISNYSLGQAAERWGMDWFPLAGLCLTILLMLTLLGLVNKIKHRT